MADKQRIFLIDGSALAYRSHFAFIRNPLINSKGMNTSAAFGFVNLLLKIHGEDAPDTIIVTFDAPQKTFRHETYPEYKATREKMPDEMREQIPWIHKMVDALGFPLVVMPGYEADDVIGTLARIGEEKGHEITIVTGDKDLLQLVTDKIRVYNPWAKGNSGIFGAKEVEKKLGVPPERVRDLLALMGDKSDNVPGVPSVGEKTAKKLLEQFGSLEACLDKADEVKAKRARENLKEYADQAKLSYELVTIKTDVPLEVSLDTLMAAEMDRDTLGEIFEELEFRELRKRFSRNVSRDDHEYHTVEDEAALATLIKQLRKAGEFVIDLETTSLDPSQAQLVGFAVAWEKNVAWYVPTNLEPEVPEGQTGSLFAGMEEDREDAVLEQLRPLLEDATIGKGGQNLKYDAMVLAEHGVTLRGIRFDTLLESYLIDPASRTHGLDDLSLRYLNYRKIATKDLIGRGRKQKTMAELPREQVATYACEDADICLRLHGIFAEKLDKTPGLRELYETVELPLMDVLMRMEQRGIAIDEAMLGELSKEFEAKAAELEAKAFELAGGEFNLNSPKQLREILYDKLEIHKTAKVRPRKTSSGDLSTDVGVLERLAAAHPLPRVILDYRGFTKLKGTYVDALPKLVNDKTGRIHTSFNQAVAATGRLSSSDPNLQNIPIRTPEGMRIRGAFVAGEPGWVLVSADYSQVELRLMAHFSEEPTLVEAFRKGADIHRATAAQIFHVEEDAVTSEQRSRAKAINFGIMYGMGPQRLGRETDISTAEAKEFIESYFATYPKVKEYIEAQLETAREKGYVETLLKRRRDVREINSGNRMVRANAERVATNTPIQGSAADLIKLAMLTIDKRLQGEDWQSRMLLQVHDELVFECPETELDRLVAMVREEMEGVRELRVPLVVEVGHGRSWLEAH